MILSTYNENKEDEDMSLKLSGGLDCKTTSGGAGFSEGYGIRLGEEYITPEDFVEFVMYVMTNTDLAPNDPRRELKERLSGLMEIPGFNRGNVRYSQALEKMGLDYRVLAPDEFPEPGMEV